jgi:hypothetical protein
LDVVGQIVVDRSKEIEYRIESLESFYENLKSKLNEIIGVVNGSEIKDQLIS